MRSKVRNLLHDGNDLLAPDGSVGCTATDYLRALEKLRDSVSAFEEVAGPTVRKRIADAAHAPGQIRETADRITARQLELRDWCAWRKRRAEAIDSGLQPLVNAVEAGGVPHRC